jgi:hypothetical protein
MLTIFLYFLKISKTKKIKLKTPAIKNGAMTHHQDNVVDPFNFNIVNSIIVKIKNFTLFFEISIFSIFFFELQRYGKKINYPT